MKHQMMAKIAGKWRSPQTSQDAGIDLSPLCPEQPPTWKGIFSSSEDSVRILTSKEHINMGYYDI
jgi:hypothetical protein